MVCLLEGATVVEGRTGSEIQGSKKGVSCKSESRKKSDREEGV